ncbi:MAG: squalene/phytoene synthase family protein [Nitrospinales bacterium]
MDDWDYCRNILPKVSRTFALNISVLKGNLHRSVLTGYLFCRIIDTVEDAGKLDPKIKIKLLLEFSRLLQDPARRAASLDSWVEACHVVDGSPNDLELLSQTSRAFNVFDSLLESHKAQIVPCVSEMAQGMAYFQNKFHADGLTLLETENELEEYCYFVAGCVGEMLRRLFFVELPHLSEKAKRTMKRNAVSFGLGLQMTNITKDFIVDRKRGWSYIPRSLITSNGLTVDEFGSDELMEKNLQVIKCLLRKTLGHLQDALKFTLAIPRSEISMRLFCIWPLWMAMETVAVLLNNQALLNSEDPVKISRATVQRILRRTPWFSCSNFLLRRSFAKISKRCDCGVPSPFYIENLKARLSKISLDTHGSNALYA